MKTVRIFLGILVSISKESLAAINATELRDGSTMTSFRNEGGGMAACYKS